MSHKWFRMYSEFATDPVVQSLAFEDQRHYVMILCFKCSGVLDRNISPKERNRIILRGLGLDSVAGDEAKRRLMDIGVIDKNWQPKNWDKRQFISDDSTARVHKHRKNKESCNVSVTPPDTDTDTDVNLSSSLRSEDKLKPPVSPVHENSSTDAASATEQTASVPAGDLPEQRGSGKRVRGSKRCPADFVVTADMRKWAAQSCPNLDIEAESAAFRDHEFAAARSDWPAAWRNWMRRTTKFARPNHAPQAPKNAAFRPFPGTEHDKDPRR
jgi:hypothetical protein